MEKIEQKLRKAKEAFWLSWRYADFFKRTLTNEKNFKNESEYTIKELSKGVSFCKEMLFKCEVLLERTKFDKEKQKEALKKYEEYSNSLKECKEKLKQAKKDSRAYFYNYLNKTKEDLKMGIKQLRDLKKIQSNFQAS